MVCYDWSYWCYEYMEVRSFSSKGFFSSLCILVLKTGTQYLDFLGWNNTKHHRSAPLTVLEFRDIYVDLLCVSKMKNLDQP